jgi:PAS domain S-box-containing protein
MQSPQSNLILEICRSWATKNNLTVYDKKNHKGLLRYLIVRHSKSKDAFLLNLVATDFVDTNELIQDLISADIDLKSFYVSINKNVADTAWTDSKKLVFGESYLEEKIKDIIYRIGPYSFFQINSKQLEKMYFIVKDWLKDGDMLIDLYCGVGGFSLFLSNIFKEVVGIEISQEAIDLANQNKFINNIKNCNFLCGSVEQILEDDKIDLTRNISMIIDPPRTGIGKKSLKKILAILPKTLIYVSCNPKTMADDLVYLLRIYDLAEIKAVDMFPNTKHVETIAFLKLKENPKLFLYKNSNKKNCLNLFNISKFETDMNGFLINTNNSFYRFLEKFSVNKSDITNLNILDLFINTDLVKNFKFKDGEYKNIKRFFDGSFGLAIFDVHNSVKNEFFTFELSFERDEAGIKGLIKDYSISDKNVLDFLKANIFFKYSNNVIITDINWNIKYVNNNFLKNINTSFDELLDMSLASITHLSNFSVFIKKIEQELVEKNFWDGEFIFRSSLNKIFYYETKIFLLENQDENKFLILQNDITEKITLERDLINKSNKHNDLLRQIYDLDNLKEDFLKLKLKTDSSNPVQMESLMSNIDVLLKKIKDLKNSCLVNINTDNMNMGYCNLPKMLNAQIDIFKPRFIEKNIEFKFFYDCLLENIYVDENLFKTVFADIFENSLKFLPENSVFYLNVIQKNGFLRINTIDERQSIAPENKEKILWEHFEKYENDGLIRVRKIIEMHNGSFLLESPAKELGKGVELLIKVPIEKREYNR